MSANEQYLIAQMRNMEMRLLRLQRDFERLRGIQQGAEVPFDRQIYAGNGLIGGGDLSQNRTLSVSVKPYVSDTSAGALGFDNGDLYVRRGFSLIYNSFNQLVVDAGQGLAIAQANNEPQSGDLRGKLYVKIGTGLAYSNGAIIATGGGGGGTTVNAGDGLSFEQDGSTLKVNVSGLISLQNDSVTLSNGTAKNQVIATYTDNNNQTVHGWRDLSNYAGIGLSFDADTNTFAIASTSAGQGLIWNNQVSPQRFDIGAGDGITVNADSIQINPNIAGQGLFWNDQVNPKRFDIGAGDGITVNADSVQINTNIAGIGLQWNNTTKAIDVKIADVNTGSSATGANFGLYLDNDTVNLGYSSEPKTSSQILATNNGLLTLSNLTIQQTAVGSTTTGIFKVQSQLSEGPNTANPVFIVDAYNRQVGINKPPDPQFDLDVNGALRATYLIGRHAIQVEKLTMISHFDGASEDGVFGEPNGHMNQTGSRTGVIFFYRQPNAKFSKALGMTLNTVNLVTNPSFEYDNNGVAPSGWTYSGTGGSALTDTTRYWVGAKSVKITSGTSANSIIFTNNFYSGTAPTAGTVFWAQARIYRINPLKGVSLTIRRGGTNVSTTTVTLPVDNSDGGGEWEWIYTSYTVQSGDTATQYGLEINNLAADGTAIWVDAVQFENNAFNPYFDGSLGGYNNDVRIFPTINNNTGACWTGTAHLSSSSSGLTAVVSRLEYKTNRTGLITSVGSIFGWIYPTSLTIGITNFAFFSFIRNANATLRLFITDNGVVFLNFLGQTFQTSALGASTFLNKWSFITLTWSGTSIKLYLNAANIGTFTLTAPTFTEFDPELRMGPGRGFFDEFGVVQRELPEKEIVSIYQSNAPVFAESSTFNFRPTPNGLVWADERGLWVQQQNGKAAFGIYGGTDATYTWGGIALNQGDVLIGESPNYIRFRPDVGSLLIRTQESSTSSAGITIDSSTGIDIRTKDSGASSPLSINSYSFSSLGSNIGGLSYIVTSVPSGTTGKVLNLYTVDNAGSTYQVSEANSIQVSTGVADIFIGNSSNNDALGQYIRLTPAYGASPNLESQLINIVNKGRINLTAGLSNSTNTSITLTSKSIYLRHFAGGSIYFGQDGQSTGFVTISRANSINTLDLGSGSITSENYTLSSAKIGYSFIGQPSLTTPVAGAFWGYTALGNAADSLDKVSMQATAFSSGHAGTLIFRTGTSFEFLHTGATVISINSSETNIVKPILMNRNTGVTTSSGATTSTFAQVKMYVKSMLVSGSTYKPIVVFAWRDSGNQQRYSYIDLSVANTYTVANLSNEP